MHPSLTRAFYEHLGHAISAALRQSPDRSRRHYCYDGILDPEWAEDYQPEFVRQSRRIVLRAWVDEGLGQGGGSSEQSVWRLTVKLGLRSYPRYLQGSSLKPYVPAADAPDWVLLRAEQRLLDVQLL